jgi:Asp-tRNA(Asn)/Glu-tRNA(Gln) amidotransferase B subunit
VSGTAVLAEMERGGGSLADVVERRSLRQESDPAALALLVEQVIAANAAKADEYRAGKTGLLGFFVGQVMRQSGGNANPALVSQLVQERLGG